MRRLGVTLLPGATAVLILAMTVAASPVATTSGVYYWGYTFAQAHLSPTVMPIPGTVVQVASSNTTLYALTATGQVYAWGIGTSGQLGDGGTTDSSTPVQVNFPAGVSIASLPTDVMPNAGALAVDTNGNVWAWGDDVHGVDCMGQSEYLTPVKVPLTDVTLISSASGHALYEAGGTLYACGGNSLGELGDGSTATRTGPVEVTGLAGQTVVGLYSSSQDAYALTAAGAIYAWGGNAEDELCNGSSVVYSDVPVQVPFTDSSPATQVAAGGSLSSNGSLLARLADGTVWACGSDTYGQLGDGGSTNQAVPVEVFPPAGVTYQKIAMSGATGYAVDSDGDVWAWGWDVEGQVGNGVRQSAELTPVEVLTGEGVTQISATAQDVVVLASGPTATPTPTPTPTATPTPTPTPTPTSTPTPLPGAPALSQAFGAAAGTTTTSSLTASTTTPTANGDLLVVTVLVRNVDTLVKVGSVSDNTGDLFTPVTAVVRGSQTDEEMWEAANSLGGATTVSVALPTTASLSMTVLDITGAGASPVDARSTSSGTSTAATTGTAPSTESPEIAVACLGWNTKPTLTGTSAGYTALPVEESSVAGWLSGEQTAYMILSTAGAQSYAGTFSASVVWTGALVTFS